MQTSYRDLAEFRLPFVTPEQPEFSALAREILSLPPVPPAQFVGGLEGAAVLLNNSTRTIVSLSVLVRFRADARYVATNRFSSLLSSHTIDLLNGDLLNGRVQPGIIHRSVILPGSKRLVTDRGVWGNNYDVRPPPRRLTDREDSALVNWLEQEARPPQLHLRRM